MCRWRLILCFLFTGLKTGRIRVILDGSREEAKETNLVQGETADFHLKPFKREAPGGAPRGIFLTRIPKILWQHLNHHDCDELPVLFHPSVHADVFLCPDKLQQLCNQTSLIRFGFYVPINFQL